LLTALGTVCFVTGVVEPELGRTYHVNVLEDIVNVSFFVKFVLLFWTQDFKVPWLFSGKGALDLASCLPVFCIPARLLGGPSLERTADLLQIGRFLRLLREALPSDDGKVHDYEVPIGQQVFSVLLALLGTVVVSAAVLFSFENPVDQVTIVRSFEDSLVYMVCIFAGRDPPWYPEKPRAKLASAIATCCGVIFIPFLISRSLEVFMPSMKKDNEKARLALAMAQSIAEDDGLTPWVAVIRRIDALDSGGLLTLGEANEIRRLCLARDDKVKMLDLCYGSEGPADTVALRLYAARLRELLISNAGRP